LSLATGARDRRHRAAARRVDRCPVAGAHEQTTVRQPCNASSLFVQQYLRIDARSHRCPRFEPLSPVAAWDKMLEAVTFDLWLDLDESSWEEVRRRLATTSSLYRAARKAMAQPRSAVGRRLANALRDAEESGIMGALMWANWADTT